MPPQQPPALPGCTAQVGQSGGFQPPSPGFHTAGVNMPQAPRGCCPQAGGEGMGHKPWAQRPEEPPGAGQRGPGQMLAKSGTEEQGTLWCVELRMTTCICKCVAGLVSPLACCWEQDQRAGCGPCGQDSIRGSARTPADPGGGRSRTPRTGTALTRAPTRAPLRPQMPCPRPRDQPPQPPHPYPGGLFGLHLVFRIILRIKNRDC